MDELDTPNCPDCLEPMQPRAAWWYCQPCRVYVDVLGRRYTEPHDVEPTADHGTAARIGDS